MSDRFTSVSPSDPTDELGSFEISDAAAVDRAVARARAAFPAWRDAGLEARTRVLERFRDLARERQAELAELISREVGKAHWETKGEASLLAAKVDATLGAGMQLVAPMEAGAGARAIFMARGVLAVLGPFNFPAHLPNGHIVPALATGNTVVFKPSELSPAVGAWMAELWHQAGLPDGVLELVQGPAETGKSLSLHDDVDGVLFTGSYSVGRWLRQATLDQPHKILALEMGGKNAVVVLADAELELAVAETALSVAASTGQRCTCASRIFVEHSLIDAFTDKLRKVLASIRIGPPLEEGVFMGPLCSRGAYDKALQYRSMIEEAGGERILEVNPDLPPPFIGPGLARFSDTCQSHAYQRDEIFAPEAALYPVDDLEHAITAVNDTDFGLAASVMTRERENFDSCVGRIRAGVLNWNRGTVGASGKLPFGGIKKSGNDRPAGISATLYCTVPQAHLEYEGGFDPESLPPGMPKP